MSDKRSQTQPNILIVEDEEGPRESLKMILSQDYNLFTVDRAEVALQLLQVQPIDVITLDLKLPGRQGLDLLREIRQEGKDADVLIITGYGTLQSAIEAIQLGISAYMLKPFNVADLRTIISKTLDRRRRVHDLQESLRAYSALWSIEGNPSALFENFKTLLNATNPNFNQHAKRVSHYAVMLAEKLGLPPDVRDTIQLGAYLHDMGKIGLQDRLAMGQHPADEQERALWQCHPSIGERMIQALPFPESVRDMVLYHHERFDGLGFPRKLAGEEIPLTARIVGIANFFDNLVTGETEYGAVAVPEARERIRREAGHRLDPQLAELFPQVIW